MTDQLLDVVRVEIGPDYLLVLDFENGERRVFDMAPFMDKKPFVQLKDSPLFAMASVAYGTMVWPGNIDIAPETLYDHSQPVSGQGELRQFRGKLNWEGDLDRMRRDD